MRFEVMPDLDVRPPQFEDFQEDFPMDPMATLAAEQGAHDQVRLSSAEQDTITDMEEQFAPQKQGPVPPIELTGTESLADFRAKIGAVLVGVNTVLKDEKGLGKDIAAFNKTTADIRAAEEQQRVIDMNDFQNRLNEKKKAESKKDESDSTSEIAA